MVAMIPLILIGVLFGLVPLVGLIVLQVYLSKLEKDWPGLILPILSLSVSLFYTFFALFFAVRGGVIIVVLGALLLFYIPPLVFFLIYKNVHKKQAPKNELDKMTLQDL